jgi:phosphatidate cytidylyltransferase
VISANFRLRFLTATVGLPLFFVLIFILPHLYHLGFNILVTAATVLGGLELARLLQAQGIPPFRPVPDLGGLLPAVAYLQTSGLLPRGGLWAALTGLVTLVLLASLIARREEELRPMLSRTASSLLVLLYPGLFAAFVVLLSSLPEASLSLLLFFSLVFVNDLLAYTAGMLARGWSRLGWAVSPNKSAIGFIAGMIGSIGIAVLYRALAPHLLPAGYPAVIVFGALIGVLTILGDLVESALKRSARVKDSSGVIPGRGGVLDSIDSWLLAAPAFYLFFQWMWHGPRF